MKIGISSSCLYPMYTEESFRLIASNGVNLSEIFFNANCELEPSFIKQLREIKDQYSVELTSIHPTMSLAESFMLFSNYDRRFNEGMDAYKRYGEIAAELNAKYVIMHGGKPNGTMDDYGYFDRFARVAEVQAANIPVLVMQNDDVVIPARVKCGQAVEDARLYVSGGCHEIVLADTEVCTRADSWINLPRILLDSMEKHADAADFDDFYAAFLSDVRAYYLRIVELKNAGERHWCEFDPLPLYSSSLVGPLESGLDVTEGGAKYNSTAPSMVGAATLIDSLYSIKTLVFEEKQLDIARFLEILANDFRGEEALRRDICKRIPKHGTNKEVLNRFSASVLADLASVSHQTNARGGKYLPAFYPHDIYRPLGGKTGATPDGRRAHTPLSRGISPSEFIDTESPLDCILSLEDIDFTQFADSFIAEITLPEMENNKANREILIAIIRGFLTVGGSSLQFNLTNSSTLKAARENPEQYKNVLVRVCGYSAPFVYLCKQTQDEIISRAIR